MTHWTLNDKGNWKFCGNKNRGSKKLKYDFKEWLFREEEEEETWPVEEARKIEGILQVQLIYICS